MLDIGWSELLIVAVVAIIVIGPKELPRALRSAGYWVNKVRGVAREFQSSIDDMIRDSELADLKKEAQSITDGDVNDFGRQSDPTGSSDGTFDWSADDDDDAMDEHARDTAETSPHSILPPEEDVAEADEGAATSGSTADGGSEEGAPTTPEVTRNQANG